MFTLGILLPPLDFVRLNTGPQTIQFFPLCLIGVGPGLGCTSPQTSMAVVVMLYDAEVLL